MKKGKRGIYIKSKDTQEAVINSWDVVKRRADYPKITVTYFVRNLTAYVIEKYQMQIYNYLHTASDGRLIYMCKIEGHRIALSMGGTGASTAVNKHEELSALGMESITVFGTCDVLDSSIGGCITLPPTLAYRNEGTSLRYIQANQVIAVNVNIHIQMKQFF